MNKRQLKKRRKKCLPVIADEANLLIMTDEERSEAYKEYQNFVRNYSYRKKYKNLKGKHLVYFYPVGKKIGDFINEMGKRCRKGTVDKKESPMVTQSLNDFIGVHDEYTKNSIDMVSSIVGELKGEEALKFIESINVDSSKAKFSKH